MKTGMGEIWECNKRVVKEMENVLHLKMINN